MKPDDGIKDRIRALSNRKKLPDKTPYTCISVNNIINISGNSGISCREIEIASLEEEIIPERYVRNMKSFSATDQATLLKSRITIVGLGGLGGVVTEILARMGVGIINLVDGDVFEESNFRNLDLAQASHNMSSAVIAVFLNS